MTAPAPSRHTRVSELDGLRGIAILLVIFFHYTPTTGPLAFLAHFFQAGWMGVDLFFVLSGYLITGILLDTAGKPHYYRNFIVRRSLRIFPLYYACLAFYAFLTFYPNAVNWKQYWSNETWWYAAYLGNVQNFVTNKWPGWAILTPLWSLQVEEQYYLTFPLIVYLLSRRQLRVALFAALGVGLALRIALVIVWPKNLVGTYVLMPCRMDPLAMGGLIAIAARETPDALRQRWVGWMTVGCAVTFVAICAFYTTEPWSAAMRTVGFSALDLTFAGILIMLMAWRSPVLLRICRTRWLVYVGTISYGLYLLHIPAAVIVHHLHISPRGTLDFVLSTAIALVLATVSWKVFESPILRLKARFTL